MKLADIKINEEYALVEGKHSNTNPRQVKVLAIEPVEVKKWNELRGLYVTVNSRQVKVKFLDKPRGRYDWAKGAVKHVPPAQIGALWSEVNPAIQKRKDEERRAEELMAATEKRLRALLGRNYDGYFTASGRRTTLSLYGSSIEKILALAEKGKGITNA